MIDISNDNVQKVLLNKKDLKAVFPSSCLENYLPLSSSTQSLSLSHYFSCTSTNYSEVTFQYLRYLIPFTIHHLHLEKNFKNQRRNYNGTRSKQNLIKKRSSKHNWTIKRQKPDKKGAEKWGGYIAMSLWEVIQITTMNPWLHFLRGKFKGLRMTRFWWY